MTGAQSIFAFQPAWRRTALAASGLALLMAAAAFLTGNALSGRAENELVRDATAEASFRAAILSQHLQQSRDVPKVLADVPEVRAAIALRASDPQAVALSEVFERLVQQTEAKALYLIGPDGVSLAASNWRIPDNFLGQDYNFRPYFTQAISHGAHEFFALGTISAAAGLYIAQRVTGRDGNGVVVVKVHLDHVEEGWRRSLGQVAVTDARGVIVLASEPTWRFGLTRPLSDGDLAEIRRSRQFGDDPALPMVSLPAPGDMTGASIAVSRPVANSEWSLTYSVSTTPIANARVAGQAVGGLSALVAGVAFIMFHNRRRRIEQERRREEITRLDLEARVAERTQDLRAANEQLTQEATERKRVETQARLLQDELFQANRLAVLGQVSASVAHEINQPLAAIRAFSENAIAFLERRQPDDTKANLIHIIGLASRINTITDQLRMMARKSLEPREKVVIADAIEGALLLIGPRARAAGVEIDLDAQSDPLVVHAHRMRLEQVLLNLLQNALDACQEGQKPRILIAVRNDGADAQIDVVDNGPGLASDAAQALFTPFNTTKPNGLGLGLVISLEICREYGGSLEPIASPLGGAGFRITLPVVS
jgi:two-component system C4-dicarboxylate transport sensor histidine kinase DctB